MVVPAPPGAFCWEAQCFDYAASRNKANVWPFSTELTGVPYFQPVDNDTKSWK